MAEFGDGYPRAGMGMRSLCETRRNKGLLVGKKTVGEQQEGTQGTSSQNKKPLHSQGRKELDLPAEEFLSLEVVNIT